MPNIEDQLRKAFEEGKFDNLPNKGKQIKLDENPFADPEMQATYTMLKGSGFSLPWIEARHELDELIETARTELKRTWLWCQGAKSQNHPGDFVDKEWRRAQELFRERVKEINKRLLSYNIQTPSSRFQLTPMNAEKEIEALQ